MTKILFVGDARVGKTSMIRTLLTHSFPSEVPPVSPPVSIKLSTSEYILIDTSPTDSTRLENLIAASDLVVLVYDMNSPETQRRVFSHWLPLLEGSSTIVVGNKKDLPNLGVPTDEFSQRVLAEFPSCYLCIESSSTTYMAISVLLSVIEKQLEYPIKPLINSRTKEPSPELARALSCIFRQIDTDFDGYLSDEELSNFNSKVFGCKMAPVALAKLRSKIGRCGFFEFLDLHVQMVRDFKLDLIWKILNSFGFEKDLQRSIDTSGIRNVELSDNAISFLAMLFQQESENFELSIEGLKNIFRCMEYPPWAPDTDAWGDILKNVYSKENKLTVHSWISIWVLLTAKYPEIALSNLMMIGYPGSLQSAYYKVEGSSKKVFSVSILGLKSSGKSDLLRSFLHKKRGEVVGRDVCNVIEDTDSLFNCKYLVISNRNHVCEGSDVVCLLFNGSQNSMRFTKENLIPNLKKSIPKLLVYNKIHENENAYAFFLETGIREHIIISLDKQRPDGLFRYIRDLALVPAKPVVSKVQKRPRASYLFYGIICLGLLFAIRKTVQIYTK